MKVITISDISQRESLNLIGGFETTSKNMGLEEADQHPVREQPVPVKLLLKENNYAND